MAAGFDTSVVCDSCHATMVRGMRFCRHCGYRLGEGVEEYAPTQLFNETPPRARTATAPNPAANVTAMPGEWGAMVSPAALNTSALDQGRESKLKRAGRFCNPSRFNWFVWLIVAIAIMSAVGGLTRQIRVNGERRVRPSVERSYVGANIEDGDGGALLESVMPPGSPADRAGLIGGDVISKFDGRDVRDEDDLTKLLEATPAGKTIEVVFTRDGESRTATLTTVSGDDRRKLQEAFARRPEGEGFLGIDPGDLKRVAIPEQKIYGVRLGEVMRNRPGYIAGLREGDIVLEFDGAPVRTGADFVARIERALPDSVVKVVVIRGVERLEIPVRMGVD
ncbi:MAG: PDZ domain-containing protein [Pyrinomonadaceae bacterium]